jgi:hypothetical protein
MQPSNLFPVLLLSVCGATATAQVGAPAALPAGAFRVPLHDDPDEPGPALWASGDAYKVRIDGGFRFLPLRGSAARPLPLAWRTASVQVGDQVVPAAARPVVRHSAWRCDLDHGEVVESYEVRPEGVEQTFTLRRAFGAGDLVVRGRIASELAASPAAAEHRALAFRDAAGRTVVTYGAATAIDAAGRTQPMTTSFDGDCVELRLAAGWLADASYPVVVDPLFATGDVVSHLTDGVLGGVSVASSDRAPRRLLVVYHRAFSSGDRDVFGFTCEAGFVNPSRVFSRTGGFDDHDPSAAFHSASNQWVVAFERSWGTGRNVHVYLHPRDGLVENAGTPLSVPLLAGEDAGMPVVGGTRRASAAPRVLLAYESYRGGSVPEVVTVALDATTRQFVGMPQHVGSTSASVGQMRGRPAINQIGAFNDTGWVVTWEQSSPASGLAIAASRYDSQGSKLGSAIVVAGEAGSHAVQPRIAGTGTEFFATWGRRALAAGSPVTVLAGRRVAWPIGAAPEFGVVRTLDLGGGPSAVQFANGGVGFDWHAGSQWIAAWLRTSTSGSTTTTRGQVQRLGATGGVVEAVQLDPALGRGTSIAVTYDWESDVFPVAYATQQTLPTRNVLRGFDYRYPETATSLSYGTSCSQATIGSTRPLAGNAHFTVSASGTNIPVPVGVLLLGGASAQISLAGLGMSGCSLLVSPNPLVHLPATGNGGILAVRLPLPDAPVLRGMFRCQFAYLDPAANALGVRTTAGLLVSVQ